MIRIEKFYRGCYGKVEIDIDFKVRCNGMMWVRNGITDVLIYY